jgi:undecaprenyl pyrophosphate phosphatase UppP
MRFFINFVSKHGFRAFGVYRIIAGSVILYLALHQVI